MEDTGSQNCQSFSGSMEQKNNQMTPMPTIVRDESSPHDDNADDLWCEDDDAVLNNDFSHASLLNREWEWRHERFHTMGYRDGITAGKEACAQEGFNAGFKQSVRIGQNWGLVRGITSALASLPDNLKEKLVRNEDTRGRFQDLYTSVQKVSSNDALIAFHASIKHAEAAGSVDDFVRDKSHERIFGNQLDSHRKELSSLLGESAEIKVSEESRIMP